MSQFKVSKLELPSARGLERCILVRIPDELMNSDALDSIIRMVIAVREAEDVYPTRSTLLFVAMDYDTSRYKTFEELQAALSGAE